MVILGTLWEWPLARGVWSSIVSGAATSDCLEEPANVPDFKSLGESVDPSCFRCLGNTPCVLFLRMFWLDVEPLSAGFDEGQQTTISDDSLFRIEALFPDVEPSLDLSSASVGLDPPRLLAAFEASLPSEESVVAIVPAPWKTRRASSICEEGL